MGTLADAFRDPDQTPQEPKNQFEREFATCSMRHPKSFDPLNCSWCGSKLPVTKKTGRPAKNRRWCSKSCSNEMLRNHFWTWARKEAVRRDKGTCVRCGAVGHEARIEVNHIVPRVGKGYNMSCGHHLENLECLCSGKGSCHVEITKAQREERKRNADS